MLSFYLSLLIIAYYQGFEPYNNLFFENLGGLSLLSFWVIYVDTPVQMVVYNSSQFIYHYIAVLKNIIIQKLGHGDHYGIDPTTWKKIC